MPPMTPLLLGFVSHHQQVALILTGVNVCEPIYSRTGGVTPDGIKAKLGKILQGADPHTPRRPTGP